MLPIDYPLALNRVRVYWWLLSKMCATSGFDLEQRQDRNHGGRRD